MDRRNFIKNLGIGAAVITTSTVLVKSATQKHQEDLMLQAEPTQGMIAFAMSGALELPDPKAPFTEEDWDAIDAYLDGIDFPEQYCYWTVDPITGKLTEYRSYR